MSSAAPPCGKRSGMIAITSDDRDQLIGISPE
jgi:hypothetical protein